MNSRIFLTSLLAAAISVSTLAAQESPAKAKADEVRKANQIREEEAEKLLTSLEARCKKMLALQVTVLNGTRNLHNVIEENGAKKPLPEDRKAALNLAAKMAELINEATRAIDILEAEGSAVAFPEVFKQVRDDMLKVRARLEQCDVGNDTQALAEDIVETFREMTQALVKGRSS